MQQAIYEGSGSGSGRHDAGQQLCGIVALQGTAAALCAGGQVVVADPWVGDHAAAAQLAPVVLPVLLLQAVKGVQQTRELDRQPSVDF